MDFLNEPIVTAAKASPVPSPVFAGDFTSLPTSSADLAANLIIIIACVLGFAYALWRTRDVLSVQIDPEARVSENAKLIQEEGRTPRPDVLLKINTIAKAISEGATSFLFAEYRYMAVFMLLFSIIILVVLGTTPPPEGHDHSWVWINAAFSTLSFNLGCITSIVSGFIGMKIAVLANSRTALRAMEGVAPAFDTAFRAGLVMGFALCSLALTNLYIAILLYRLYYNGSNPNDASTLENVEALMDSISAYGLGGSSIALFGRVGGGIYTKAADVGADLVGKVEQGIPEDDPRNPAVIADNVGDNVGDIAGMGADLFGSFAESTCAALVVSSQARGLAYSWAGLMFPLTISAAGLIVCFFTSFIATNLMPTNEEKDIEPSLKRQLLVSTTLMTPVAVGLCYGFLPNEFDLLANGTVYHIHWWGVFICIACGLWSGLIIGYITEYYTSHSYAPVRDVADSCKTGAATNIIYGLALGYKSVIIPVFCLCITIFIGFHFAGVYGIAIAALGILSTLSIGLTIDAYGPISDNAGGIAEMAGMGHEIRKRTDALDAAGNTTAAIGKGFAIASAAMVSLALFGAFTTRAQIVTINVLDPWTFAGLLFGAMLPYWFSAMTMKSVGTAALAMVEEVRDQFRNIPGLMDGSGTPDYRRCVAISTDASLKEMIPPGALVMLTPLLAGFLLDTKFLAGMLSGAIVSGVQMAISSSNTGGAWDNAKKYIEAGYLGGKGTECHHAAVIGDTVGDPLKDTSGPALNILMKLMAIISVVFGAAMHLNGSVIGQHVN